MKDFMDAGGATGAVIAVLFCKVSKWTRGTSIQTTQRTSRMLFNPDIPESDSLRASMRSSQSLTATSLTITQRVQTNLIEESFFSIDQKFTLADIRDLIAVNDFVSTATINSTGSD